MPTRLTINFIVHNDFSHIETALQSVQDNTAIDSTIYVVVNTGYTPEVDRIQAKYPAVHIILNDHPVGFAANHNAIMRIATTDYVALMNDDIYLPPGTLDILVGYLDEHPDVGLVGPIVENPDGTPQLSAFSDPTLLRMLYKISGMGYLTRHGGWVRLTLQRLGIAQRLGVKSLKTQPVTRAVPVIVGVSMVVRREAYLEAGLMDEATNVYGEEYVWHWRLRQQGWKVVLVAEARIIHYNPESDLKGWKLAEHRKSILHYFADYRPAWQASVIRWAIIGIHSLATVVYFPFNRAVARDHWQAAQIGFSWKSRIKDNI